MYRRQHLDLESQFLRCKNRLRQTCVWNDFPRSHPFFNLCEWDCALMKTCGWQNMISLISWRLFVRSKLTYLVYCSRHLFSTFISQIAICLISFMKFTGNESFMVFVKWWEFVKEGSCRGGEKTELKLPKALQKGADDCATNFWHYEFMRFFWELSMRLKW